MQLVDESGDDHHYLRVRASGTEPINRIYVESSSLKTGQQMMKAALGQLERLTMESLKKAHSTWNLADMLTQTTLSTTLLEVVRKVLSDNNWSTEDLKKKLQQMRYALEKRNRKVAAGWLGALQ